MTDLAVLGAVNWDFNIFVENFAKIGEEVTIKNMTRVPGGKAANVAVAAARILGSLKVALIGGIGKDSIGENQIQILHDEGIDTSGIKHIDDVESGQAYIIIDKDGKNIIHTLFGANLEILPEDLIVQPRHSIIEDTSLIVIMDPPLQTALRMAKLGEKYGKTVLWDPGVRCARGANKLTNIIKKVQYLVINEVESVNLTGLRDLKQSGDRLLKMNGLMKIVIKLGAKGCVMIDQDGMIHIPGIPLTKVGMKAVNTVGCGDAFLGALSAFLASSMDDVEAVERANLAGAFKATKTVTRGSPTRKELEEFSRHISNIK